MAQPLVLVTGVASSVGAAIVAALGPDYRVVGMDVAGTEASVPVIPVDLTDDGSVADAFRALRAQHGDAIASVVHLAGYYDFSGEEHPLYRALNVEGTGRLVRALQAFRVEQLVYAGTMLVHEAVRPGEHLDEEQRLGPAWVYPRSKMEAEAVIRAGRGTIPCVLLHLAGVYDEAHVVPTLAHQIDRIARRTAESHLYPGDLATGQSMVHRDDMADAFRRAVDRRDRLPDEAVILVGEAEPIGYADLQDRIARLLHGEDWTTLRVPQALAAAGAAVEEAVLPHLPDALGGGEAPFVRPFMAWQGSDHYALDIARARTLLGWAPRHKLAETLPAIIGALKRDPAGWRARNLQAGAG